MKKKVFLGMSGGVDSSVSAILLLEQGYEVTGVYMKNWSEDLPGMKCPWAEDLADAKRVAVRLGIDFQVWDFQEQYREKVVEYMLSEFERGRTPNPDVMCNQEIKFKLFYERALANGADYIATGHYARTSRDLVEQAENSAVDLLQAVDQNKDQTYFLYRMSDVAAARTLFPVGGMTKPEVKALAAKHKLDVVGKKESMGVCFVGEVGMKEFLQVYLQPQPGEIREIEHNKLLGYHDGVIFYTLGQRHGLYIGGGLPYYVVKKDISKNIVYVSSNLNHPALWTSELLLCDLHFRGGRTQAGIENLNDLTALSDETAKNADQNPNSAIHTINSDKNQATSQFGLNLTLNSEHTAGVFEDRVAIAVPNPGQQPHYQNHHCTEDTKKNSDAQGDLQERKQQTYQCVDKSHSAIIAQEPYYDNADPSIQPNLWVRLRHRGPLLPARLVGDKVIFAQPIKRPATGQSAVFYHGNVCLGGGIIAE